LRRIRGLHASSLPAVARRRIRALVVKTAFYVGGPFERAIVSRSGTPSWPPIFVVGPARSGTTLVFQYMAYALRLCYVSNLTAFFMGCPALASRATACFGGCDAPEQFSSYYARTRGWRSPHQGHPIWSQWFPMGTQGEAAQHWTNKQRRHLVGLVAAIENAYRSPFIAKWQGFAVDLQSVQCAFPQAVYIRVRRDFLQTAQSVLRGRYQLLGSPHKTFTRLPQGHDQLFSDNYIEHVAGYVLSMEEKMDRDAAMIGKERFFELTYDQFCRAPGNHVDRIREWYKKMTGAPLEKRNPTPHEFTPSSTPKVSEEEYTRLGEAIAAMVERKAYQVRPVGSSSSREEDNS